jgi:thymidylate kinase
MAGRYIMVDGIDGSGKSTVTSAVRDWADARLMRTFRLDTWCRDQGTIPRFEEVADKDVYFVFEPTKAWAGSAVRYEMIGAGSQYSGVEQAHGFALDRLILHRRLILPALAAGKTVVSDRGVTTSIVYQPMMPGGPTLEELLALPGNQVAMKNRPDHLVIACIPPAKALARLPSRTDGDPAQMYERIEYLTTFDERFRSEWFTNLFCELGTAVHCLNTDCSIDEARKNAADLVASMLASS